MHSMHYVVPYRGHSSPQLVDYAIKRYSEKGQVVLDPFSGRGTTALQANLEGRVAYSSDINPLAVRLTRAKTMPIGLEEVVMRLNQIDFRRPVDLSSYQEQFEPFYHPDTYRELVNLRGFLQQKSDWVNQFIELMVFSRLHGHTEAFFSAYTSPHEAMSPERQLLINLKRRQQPEYRALPPRIIKRSAQALRDGFSSDFFSISELNKIGQSDARSLEWVGTNSVDLVLCSPPFLERLDYLSDYWLSFWFGGISPRAFSASSQTFNDVETWCEFVEQSLTEMLRVLKPRSYAVIESSEKEHEGHGVCLHKLIADIATRVTGSGKRFIVEEIITNKEKFGELPGGVNDGRPKSKEQNSKLVVLKCVNQRA